MRRHAIGIAVSFLVGAFAASQGCGGSTSDTEIPSGSGAGTTGTAGSNAGGSSNAGTSGSSGQGASGAKSGSGGGGKAGASAGGASGATSGGKGGATGGTTSGGSAGTMGLDGGMTPDGTDLFDVNVPDQAIPGSDGSTVAGCYMCLKTECSQELQACEADPQCEQAATCIFQDCLASASTQIVCTVGCIQQAGISGSSPAAMEAIAIGQCGQAKCQAECGAPSGTGGSGTGGSGTGGSGTGGTSGGGATGTGGSTGATCNYGACGQVCQSQVFACYGDNLCKQCFQTQGQTAGCANDPAWQSLQTCCLQNVNGSCAGCCM